MGEKYDTDLIQFSLSQINAKPKQRFLINKLPELTVISALQEQLSVHEIGKQTGIINIAIQGKDKNTYKISFRVLLKVTYYKMSREIRQKPLKV